MASGYGYMSTPTLRKPTLAVAAAGRGPVSVNDPFGLGAGAASSAYAPPAAPRPSTTAGSGGGAGTTVKFNIQDTSPWGPQSAGALQQKTVAPTAQGVNSYDINTDPALQQIQALTGLNDQQARASATQQIRDQLLAYGDAGLAGQAALGGDSTLAQAASANPTSTLAQLGQQKTRNLKTLDDQLNAQNLSFGGYRINQESQAAQDYQNALAQAAAAVNSNIGSIQSALQAALNQDAMQRANGLFTAEQAAAAAGATGGGGGGGGDTSGAGATTTDTGPPTINSGVGSSPAVGYALAQGLVDAARQRALRGQYS